MLTDLPMSSPLDTQGGMHFRTFFWPAGQRAFSTEQLGTCTSEPEQGLEPQLQNPLSPAQHTSAVHELIPGDTSTSVHTQCSVAALHTKSPQEHSSPSSQQRTGPPIVFALHS